VGYGVQELCLIDPLYVTKRYPKAKKPKITEPTISIGRLKASPKITDCYESAQLQNIPGVLKAIVPLGSATGETTAAFE
jgi:hypothetical protein